MKKITLDRALYFGVAMSLFLASVGPFAGIFGAVKLGMLTVLEFYFIDMCINPPMYKQHSAIFSDFVLYLKEEFIMIGRHIFDYNYILTLYVPVLVALLLIPVVLSSIPARMLQTLLFLGASILVSLVGGAIIKRPLYRFIRFESLLASITVAVLMSTASMLMVTQPWLAFAAYIVAFLPLVYFSQRVEDLEKPFSQQYDVSKWANSFGSFLICVHMCEAVIASLGIITGMPVLLTTANVLTSQAVRISTAVAVTGLATAASLEQVSEQPVTVNQ